MSIPAQLLEQVFVRVDRCPVCDSPDREFHVESKKNRYSEEVALLLNVDEGAILDAVQSVRCRACGLGYKNWWFKPEYYHRIFIEAAPSHPHGWDCVSGDFRPERFVAEVDALRSAIEGQQGRNIGKHRRTVEGFISNIPGTVWNEPAAKEVKARIAGMNLNAPAAADYDFLKTSIPPLMRTPKPFGRFAGFAYDELERFIRQTVPGLRTYAEIACPLWGMLGRFGADPEIETIFVPDEHMAFWGSNCANASGVGCVAFAREMFGLDRVDSLSGLSASGTRVGMFGVINYLDHLASPIPLMRDIRDLSDYILFVTNVDEPKYQGFIQHNTAFNETSIEKMAGVLGMRIVEYLAPPAGSDNDMVLVAFECPT